MRTAQSVSFSGGIGAGKLGRKALVSVLSVVALSTTGVVWAENNTDAFSPPESLPGNQAIESNEPGVAPLARHRAIESTRGLENHGLRTRFGKVYGLEDGRRAALISAAPLHFRAADGSLVEIDNSLVLSRTAGNHVLTNNANSFSIDLPALATDATSFVFRYKSGTELLFSNATEIWHESDSGERVRILSSTTSAGKPVSNTMTYSERFPGIAELVTARDQGFDRVHFIRDASALLDGRTGGTLELRTRLQLPGGARLATTDGPQDHDFESRDDLFVIDREGNRIGVLPSAWLHQGGPADFDLELQSFATLATRVTFLEADAAVLSVRVPVTWLVGSTGAGPAAIRDTSYFYENQGGDDCFQWGSTSFNYSAAHMRVGYDSAYSFPYYLALMVFHNVNITPGSTVDFVQLNWRAESASSDASSFMWRFEASDDANPCSSEYPGDRNYVSQFDSIDNYTTSWSADSWYGVYDLKSGMQAVVDRSGWSAGNNVGLLWRPYSSSGTFRRIHSYDAGSSSAPYLYVEYTPGTADDAYEENDSLGQAWYPGSNWENEWLSDIDGLGIQADDDWFRIDVTSGYERVVIDCTFDDSDGDIDIELYNSSGVELAHSDTTTDNEHIDHVVPSSGTHYIRVFYGDEGNEYDLSWDDLEYTPTGSIGITVRDWSGSLTPDGTLVYLYETYDPDVHHEATTTGGVATFSDIDAMVYAGAEVYKPTPVYPWGEYWGGRGSVEVLEGSSSSDDIEIQRYMPYATHIEPRDASNPSLVKTQFELGEDVTIAAGFYNPDDSPHDVIIHVQADRGPSEPPDFEDSPPTYVTTGAQTGLEWHTDFTPTQIGAYYLRPKGVFTYTTGDQLTDSWEWPASPAFTVVEPQMPPEIHLDGPADGYQTTDHTPTFSYHGSDPNSNDDLTVRIYISNTTTDPFSTPMSGYPIPTWTGTSPVNTSWTPPTPLAPGNYWWGMTIDDGTDTDSSESRHLVILDYQISGSAPSGAAISLISGGVVVVSTTASGDSYAFTGLDPGTYQLYCSRIGFISSDEETVVLSSGSPHGTANFSLSPVVSLPRSIAGWIQSGGAYPVGFGSFSTNASLFDQISPMTYRILAGGAIGYDPGTDLAEVRSGAHLNSIALYPTIGADYGSAIVHAMLNDPGIRQTHIDNIVREIVTARAEGIDVDYEGINGPDGNNWDDRDEYLAFVDDLAEELHLHGKFLSMTLQPKTSTGGPQDYYEIGLDADQVRIMCYDHHWEQAIPPHHSEVSWVSDVIDFAKTEIAAGKLVVALPFYGHRDYVHGDTSLTWTGAQSEMNAHGLDPREDQTRDLGFPYTDHIPNFDYNDGSHHTVWYEDAVSTQRKLDLVLDKNIKGACFWRLGEEDPETFGRVAHMLAGLRFPEISITSIQVLNESGIPQSVFEIGDIVRFRVGFSNAGGRAPLDLEVPVNARGPDNSTIVFNGSGLGSVATGSSASVDVTWTISAGTPTGSYDVASSVRGRDFFTAYAFSAGDEGSWFTDRFVINPVEPCYPLSLSHTGSGINPVASPTSSAGCSGGEYHSGEAIQLTAAPDPGWEVESWTGTDNNQSTSNTNSLTMTASAHAASVNYLDSCFILILSHTGSGADPLANPSNSIGCTAGGYHLGEAIALTAAPDPGWQVENWSGTDNDPSTSNNNTLTMPASAQSASVTYVESCFALTLGHTGSGADLVASPLNSAGCSAGEYHFGEAIALTAVPDTGWEVGGWTGTDNNQSASTTNSLTMPASAHAASVNYLQSCFVLTLGHTGSGADPIVSPNSSTGCVAGEYHFGEPIQLTAAPDVGWEVGGWTGTDNNQSTSTTNSLTMPASTHAASANYVQSCTYSILPTSGRFPSSGGSGLVNVSSAAGCPWSASSNVSWVTICYVARPLAA